MRKFYLLIFILATTQLYAQHAYWDAQTLTKFLNDEGKFEPDGEDIKTFEKIRAEYGYVKGTNKYLDAFIAEGTGSSTQEDAKAKNQLSNLAAIDFSTFNYTAAIDGIAQFLIERASEEANVMFFHRFKKFIADQPDVKILFPASASIIESMEPYQYGYLIQALREAFRNDLGDLINQLDSTSFIKQAEIDHPNLRLALTALKLAHQIGKSDNPAKAITYFGKLDWVGKSSDVAVKNLAATFRVMTVLLESIATQQVDGWISPQDFKRNILDNKNASKIYLGLLYQRLDGIKFYSGNPVTEIDVRDQLDKLTEIIEPIVALVSEAAGEIAKLRKDIKGAAKEARAMLATEVVNRGLELITQLVASNESILAQWLPPDGLASAKTQVNKYVSLINSGAQIFDAFASRNYSSAVVHLLIFVDQEALQKLNAENKEKYKGLRENLLKYGAFIASVAQAKTGEEVKNALKAVALPVGSASIKRSVPFNISLNGYLGGFIGHENITGDDNKNGLNTAGFYAPVGLAFSVGPRKKGNGHSFTAFGQILDLGAVTAFRLQKGNAEDLPETELKNVFAPGFYLIWGIPGGPVSVGAGYQRGPALRKITLDTEPELKNGHRVGLFVAFDIPIFNLFSKAKPY